MPILSVGLSYKLNAVPNTDVGVLWCVGGPGPGTGPTCMDMHGSPLVYIYTGKPYAQPGLWGCLSLGELDRTSSWYIHLISHALVNVGGCSRARQTIRIRSLIN